LEDLKMAREKVQLRGATTYTSIFSRDRPWKRNEVRFIVDPVKITYYRQQTEFVCTSVADTEGEPSGGAPAEEPYQHTYATLNRLTKPELVAYASMTHSLELDEDNRKDDLIAAILGAQG
jgi:hypothetical protein